MKIIITLKILNGHKSHIIGAFISLFFTIALLFFCVPRVVGQVVEMDSPYLLDDFVEGRIFYSNGERRWATLNYNLVTQEVVADLGHKIVPVPIDPAADSAQIGRHLFTFVDQKPYLFLNKSPQLLYDYRFAFQIDGKNGAHGTYSGASEYGLVLTGRPEKPEDWYAKKWDTKFEFSDQAQYVLEGQTFSNKRQFLQIYKNRKRRLKSIIVKNKIDFSDPYSVTELIELAKKVVQ